MYASLVCHARWSYFRQDQHAQHSIMACNGLRYTLLEDSIEVSNKESD